MKNAILVILGLLFSSSFANATVLGDAAAGLQPGHFVELTTGLTGVDLYPDCAPGQYPNCDAGGSMLDWSDSGAWDPVLKKFYYLAKKAGDGNLYRNIIYDEASNSWSYGPVIGIGGPGHGYDGNTADPVTGIHYFRPYDSGTMYKRSGGGWTTVPTALTGPWLICAGIAKSPFGLLYADNYTYAYWRDSDQTKAQITVNSGFHHCNITEWNPVVEAFIVGGGGTSSVSRVDIVNDAPVRTVLGNAPFGNFGTTEGETQVNFTADPVSGLFIVYHRFSGVFYSYNMVSDTWQNIGFSGDGIMPPLNTGSATAPIAAPINTHGVIMYVTHQGPNARVFIYKHAEPGPPDTEDPTNVLVTAPSPGTVSGTISVTGTASDNVGVYGIQFTLDGNNLQNEDTSSPFTISWNTTTTSNGVHLLRAIARDAANNSATSPAVSVTVDNAEPPPLGTLIHDGPVTPEQISMFLPITGTIRADSCTVRYNSGGAWTTAHPLIRIRPQWVNVEDVLPDSGYGGVITGLTPNTAYTVEVTTRLDSGADNVQTINPTTRALPAAAGAPTVNISAGSSVAVIQTALDGLGPGSVLQFANGTYNITTSLIINDSGTIGSPIYIRGASRTGVVLSMGTFDNVIDIQNGSDVVIENLTIQGTGVDDGTSARSEGIRLSTCCVQQRVTIRNVIMNGVDLGVIGNGESNQTLIYDNTFNGNNPWTQSFLETNITWNDDGIRLSGFGCAAFNNTISGFGDAFSTYVQVKDAGIHYYRNEILWTNDDALEADHGYRNITFYDNRISNSMTFFSVDPLNGGPLFAFRNISINSGRSPYKLNSTNTGMFIYNNTVVRTFGFASGDNWAWNQSNNGDLRFWGYRNNILIRQSGGSLMANETGINNPIDFTNNAWFPNTSVLWTNSGGGFSTMAEARTGLPDVEPVLGTTNRRHLNDVISEADPFVTDIVLGATYLTKVITLYTPTLSGGTAPKNTGVAIPGITDGFSGGAPDMGAIISGQSAVVYGDRTAPDPPPSSPCVSIQVGQ